MYSLLLAVIYTVFISLGLPDSLLGAGWPTMRAAFSVPSSYAGYVSMAIAFMTIVSALISPRMIKRFHTKWIVIFSIMLTVIGLLGFSFSTSYAMLFLFVVPYGLGAGAIDSSVNHYVANHYSGSVMNFLHCFYGVGAVISPNIMALALSRARWNEGYRWTAYIQLGILLICILSLPLWKQNSAGAGEEEQEGAGIAQALKVPGVILTLVAFFAYCSGEATCFLWTSSYFAGVKEGLSDGMIASFGSLIFGGLMLGRLISGFVSNKLGDRFLIRIGIAVELVGIAMVMLPIQHYLPAAIGFVVTGTGMGPVYPAVQHMAPVNFGKRYSAAVIGLQMASAYVGSTFMPAVFGLLQEGVGIGIMPVYLLIFAVMNIVLLERCYAVIGRSNLLCYNSHQNAIKKIKGNRSLGDQAMSKETRQKKNKKQPRLSSEYTEGTFHFKTGSGWRACYDSDREFYSAETFWAGYYDLYEITEVVFSKLKTKGMERREACELIVTGRHLYKSVSDRNGSYDIALDEDYASLCPWADVQKTGETWDSELTDLAVAVFDSEKQNREQRLKRKNGKENTVL